MPLALIVLLLVVITSASAQAERRDRLATADTTIVLNAKSDTPQVLSLRGRHTAWSNSVPQSLPSWLMRRGEKVKLRWRLISAFSTSHRVAYIYESSEPHLRLTWEWRARSGFGPLEHRTIIRNLSGVEYWLPIMDTLRLDFQTAPGAALRQFYVEKGAGKPTDQGTHLVNVISPYNWSGWSTTFAHPVPGRPREIIPWEAVFSPEGNQSGWYAGIEFSGRTRITLAREADRLSTALGLDPDPGPALTRLSPGESFETPVVFLGAFSGGPDGAGNQLRPWVRAVLGSTRTWHNPSYPLTVNNSWGAGMGIDESVALRMIADSASLGLEMFHLDAGWFRGVGDWYADSRKFPHGLVPLADDAHRRGMKFGLWVDWAQAALDSTPGALNLRDPKVRAWLVADVAPAWMPQDFKGQTIDLGFSAARNYAAREVDRIVTSNHLDMLEHDGYLVAQGCTRHDHPHAPPDPQNTTVAHYDGEDIVLSSNSTDVSYHAVRAYYSIHDQLRRQHPGILLEVCNDGGRMVDFGSAAHGDYFSITDTYTPLANRQAFYDTSYVLPPAMLETYVEKWPTPRIENFLYELRSGMMGWVSVMQNTNDWTEEQHQAARRAIALYKSTLRPLIRDAQLFHISPRPDGIHWDGVEYWDSSRGRGAVFAFRGSDPAQREHSFVLAGLDPRAIYLLHFENGSAADVRLSGRQLMTGGMVVKLPVPLSSELILISRPAASGTHSSRKQTWRSSSAVR